MMYKMNSANIVKKNQLKALKHTNTFKLEKYVNSSKEKKKEFLNKYNIPNFDNKLLKYLMMFFLLPVIFIKFILPIYHQKKSYKKFHFAIIGSIIVLALMNLVYFTLISILDFKLKLGSLNFGLL